MSVRRYAAFLIGLVLVARLLTLGAFPLLDTSEARYGEIARLMAESGDWITPWFEPGVPFWGKPPLSFWLTAASFRMLGVSEFAARFPHWLLAYATLWLVARISHKTGALVPWRASFILATSALFFVANGAVLTEMSLLFSVTLSLAAAFNVLFADRRRWGMLFFVGLGLGALAKGPVAWVLTLAPLFAWAFLTRRMGDLCRRLPWGKGSLLCLAIAVPWYLAAEAKTPGFLDYFLLGEHFRRFVDAGWAGDLYGTAHQQPRGTIWLLALAAGLPWSLLLPVIAWTRWRRRAATLPVTGDGRQAFFLAWGLAPLFFFTFSGNILWTYVLPGLPGFALWFDQWWRRYGVDAHIGDRLLAGLGAVTPLIVVGLIFAVAGDPELARSEKNLLQTLPEKSRNEAIYYLDRRPFSASFYSQGRARLISRDELPTLLASRLPIHVAAPWRENANFLGIFPQAVRLGGNARFTMYRIDPPTPERALATSGYPTVHPTNENGGF